MARQSCFQCGLPVLSSKSQTPVLTIKGETKIFCCYGCKTVAQLINDSGLTDFYQFRNETALAKTADIVDPSNAIDFSFFDDEDINKEFVSIIDDEHKQARLYIEGIHCTACTWLIEQYIGRLPEVVRININSATHTCLIEYDKSAKLSEILGRFVELGYQPKPSIVGQYQESSEQENKIALLRLAVAGFAMIQVGMFAVALYAGALSDMATQWQSLFRWISLFVAVPVVFYSAVPFFVGARRAIYSKHLTMDVPVALAIGLAFMASCYATVTNTGDVYFDSVSMFTFFLLLGRYLEMRVRHKNEQGINQLVYLIPPHVVCLNNFPETDAQASTALSQIVAGNFICVKEGEVIPVDGVIVQSRAKQNSSDNVIGSVTGNVVEDAEPEFFVNESMLTGESTLIKKGIGDVVMAGTINYTGEMILQVTAVGMKTRLSAIQGLMNDALHQKPQQVSRADTISGYFVGFVLILSIVVAMGWYFIDPARAFWITLSVLVVTCPCALSLATPVSITAAIYKLRQLGLLITKSHVIEGLSHITHVVFDKTGTLTTGNMSIDDILCPNKEGKLEAEDDHSRRLTILSLASALEQGSSHPLAKVFIGAHGALKIGDFAEATLEVKNRRSVIGAGIEGFINGERYRIGKLEFVKELFLNKDNELSGTLLKTPMNEYSGVALGNENGLVAVFNISDTIRPEAGREVERLKERSLLVELLSGDNECAVRNVADELGLDKYQSDVTPEEKLSYLKGLQQKKAKVLMIGDGLNDLPVLSGADVSIAMSSASNLAQVQADSVLLQDNLSVISPALSCVEFCQKIIRQNLSWAIIYNVTALPLAALGFIPPYAAAIGMSLSSLFVVFNAARIYRFQKAES